MQKRQNATRRAVARKAAKPADGPKRKRAVRPAEKANQITKSGQIWAWDLEELFSTPRRRGN